MNATGGVTNALFSFCCYERETPTRTVMSNAIDRIVINNAHARARQRPCAVGGLQCALRRSEFHPMTLADWLADRAPQSTVLGSTLPVDRTNITARRSTVGIVGVLLPRPLLPSSTQLATGHANIEFLVHGLGLAESQIDAFLELAEFSQPRKTTSWAPAFANCYSGFQFGVISGQLGDGRCATFAQVGRGTPASPYADIHLKGGFTNITATKEYLMQEILAQLGIPTARSIAIGFGSRRVVREVSGKARVFGTATIVRSVSSAFRIGTLEALYYTGSHAVLADALQYFARVYAPHTVGNAVELLRFCSRRIGKMVALWTAHGFVHGVMNTDNITLLGETIDLGPCAFVSECFPDDFTLNTDDEQRMYAFSRQREAGANAVRRLANAMSPRLPNDAVAVEGAVAAYDIAFETVYRHVMLEKLGVPTVSTPDDVADDVIGKMTSLLRHAQRLCEDGTMPAGSIERQQWSYLEFIATVPTVVPLALRGEFEAWQDRIRSLPLVPRRGNPAMPLSNAVIQSVCAHVAAAPSVDERATRMATAVKWFSNILQRDSVRDQSINSVVQNTDEETQVECGCG